MSVQNSHDEENLKIEKSFQSHIPSTSSYQKKLNYSEILTREAIESWIVNNPDSYLTNLASSLGVPYHLLLAYCKRYGISFDRTKITRELLKDYLLSHPDVSYTELADHFGTVKSTAKKAVDRFGLNSLKNSQSRWSKINRERSFVPKETRSDRSKSG